MEAIELYELIHDLSENYAYIAIGDTDHRDPLIKGLRADINLFRTASEAGYVAFAIEKPPEDLAKYERDKKNIDLEAIKNNPEQAHSDMIDLGYKPLDLSTVFAQNAFGMTAIFPDSRYSESFQQTVGEVFSVLEASHLPICEDVFLQAYWKSAPDKAADYRSTIDNGDQLIAQSIAEQSDGRAFIIYGDGHFNGPHDINDLLGADKVAHIAAIPSREAGYSGGNGKDEPADYPDFIYVIEEDSVIPFSIDNPDIQTILDNFDNNITLRNMDQETFDLCTDSLPSALSYHAVTQEEFQEMRAPALSPLAP